MASSGLSINGVTITIVAVAIGIVLIGSLLAPIASDVIEDLKNLGGDGATWASLVGVVVIMAIVGLIIVAINQYTKK